MESGPNRKLYLVGLGPGPFEQLTLKTRELLASGKTVLVTDTEHDIVREMMSRGIAHEVVSVVILAGSPTTEVEVVPSLGDIDLLPAQDPLTGTYLASTAIRAGHAFARLVSVMARLRAPGGCPWDAEQTHESLALHLLEETYETLDAIDSSDVHALEEELGDILLQVIFHSEIAQESGHFEVADVIEELLAKLVQRHPHVFSDTVVKTSDEVVANWEAIKRSFKGRSSLGEGIPKSLPALLLAHKVRRRLSGVGRDYVASKEHLLELASGSLREETVGELLFEAAALAQELGIDAEAALRKHASRALLETKDR